VLVKSIRRGNLKGLVLGRSITLVQQKRLPKHYKLERQTYLKIKIQTFKKNKKLYINILHQQVPLPVPCVNFTQITIKLINIKYKNEI